MHAPGIALALPSLNQILIQNSEEMSEVPSIQNQQHFCPMHVFANSGQIKHSLPYFLK